MSCKDGLEPLMPLLGQLNSATPHLLPVGQGVRSSRRSSPPPLIPWAAFFPTLTAMLSRLPGGFCGLASR